MFESLNITFDKIAENEGNTGLFLLACGYLKNYIYYSQCLLAKPGDRFYEKNIDNCLSGEKYLETQKTKCAKKCTYNLMKLRAVNGFLRAYKVRTENGYFEDQELVVHAFENYLHDIDFSLAGRQFFAEASKLL